MSNLPMVLELGRNNCGFTWSLKYFKIILVSRGGNNYFLKSYSQYILEWLLTLCLSPTHPPPKPESSKLKIRLLTYKDIWRIQWMVQASPVRTVWGSIKDTQCSCYRCWCFIYFTICIADLIIHSFIQHTFHQSMGLALNIECICISLLFSFLCIALVMFLPPKCWK